MESVLSSLVDGEDVVMWLIIAFLVGYFAYKEWPGFVKRISDKTVKEEATAYDKQAIEHRLDRIDARLIEIEGKITNDYERINRIENKTEQQQLQINDSLVERRLIFEALYATLDGLQQLGANGKTHDASDALNRYLNDKAHQ